MENRVCEGSFALLLLLASVGFAVAADNDAMMSNDRLLRTDAQQGCLVLNDAQEQVILQGVSKQNNKKATAIPGFNAEIGQALPKSITLHRLPTDVTSRVWAVKSYDYAMLQNQLLIVSPHDRTIADIIT
jgi:aminoglycoside/choline kinase family phosphotransferase